MCQIQVSMCKAGLKSNQDVVGYSQDIPSTIAPGSIPFEASHYCSLQHSCMHETEIIFFFLLVEYTTPSKNRKASQ